MRKDEIMVASYNEQPVFELMQKMKTLHQVSKQQYKKEGFLGSKTVSWNPKKGGG